jgi:hypothetical protein
MTKHQLVEAVPTLLERVLGSDARTDEEKLEYLDFVEGMLDRAADNVDPVTDADLCWPIARLFGLIGSERRNLNGDA